MLPETPADQFQVFWDRFSAGDSRAEIEFYERFAEQLRGIARRHLGPALRTRMDSMDIVQSAFRTFTEKQQAGHLLPPSWNALWTYLVRIARFKCQEAQREHHQGVRDIRREITVPAAADAPNPAGQAAAALPTPLEAALVLDLLEHLYRRVDPKYHAILQGTLDGLTQLEISQLADCSERTVRRIQESFGRILDSA